MNEGPINKHNCLDWAMWFCREWLLPMVGLAVLFYLIAMAIEQGAKRYFETDKIDSEMKSPPPRGIAAGSQILASVNTIYSSIDSGWATVQQINGGGGVANPHIKRFEYTCSTSAANEFKTSTDNDENLQGLEVATRWEGTAHEPLRGQSLDAGNCKYRRIPKPNTSDCLATFLLLFVSSNNIVIPAVTECLRTYVGDYVGAAGVNQFYEGHSVTGSTRIPGTELIVGALRSNGSIPFPFPALNDSCLGSILYENGFVADLDKTVNRCPVSMGLPRANTLGRTMPPKQLSTTLISPVLGNAWA
jgi:hypothetical protein